MSLFTLHLFSLYKISNNIYFDGHFICSITATQFGHLRFVSTGVFNIYFTHRSVVEFLVCLDFGCYGFSFLNY